MKNIIFIIVLFSVSLAMSQETSLDITPPSPAAYALTRFEAQQPSLYTGTANISIPLYTIDFDGWKLPLSLSYHASGIQTNQEATEVGLGWSLNSTAVITRRVQQNNDFQNTLTSKGYVYEVGKIPIDYIDDFEDWNNLTEAERINIQFQLKQGLHDSEPDIFDYNFFGFSGSFVLTNKDPNNGVIEIIQLKKDGVKIEFNESSKEFTITTPTGFVGDFTVKERSTNMGGSGPLGTAENGNYGGLIDILGIQNRGNFRVITGWYVSKITSPKGKEITFEYNDDINGDSSHVSMNSTSYGQRYDFCEDPVNSSTTTAYESYGRQIHEHVYQESISISGELNISFTMEDREDLQKNDLYVNDYPVSPQKPKRYTNIQIIGLNSMSTFSKSITFNQSYFNLEYLYDNTTENEKYQYLRGRLDNVVIDDQTHSFSYNSGQNGLPNKSTKGVDLFGYYNGKDTNTWVYGVSTAPSVVNFPVECSIFINQLGLKYYYQSGLIQSDHNYAVAGALNIINYPTGGSSTYIYESHDYYVPGGNGATSNFTAEAIDQNGNAGDVIAGGIRIKEIETKNSNGEITSKKTYQYQNSLGNSSGTRLSPLAFYQDNRFHEDINNETCSYFFIQDGANLLGQNTAEGKKIGYSRITENVIGFNETYKKDYFFENHANEYGTTFSTLTRRSNINGKLNSTLDLNSNLSVVQEQDFQLLDSVIDYIKAFRYSGFGNGHSGYDQGVFLPMIYQFPFGSVEVEHVKTTSYFDSGDIETNVDYEYDSIMQINAEELTNSKGQKNRTVIKRLKDYPSSCIYASDGITCLYTAMKDKNMVNPVLEKINYVDNIVVSAIGYKYDLEHGNLVLRELYKHDASKGTFTGSTNGFQFTGSYELEVTYDDYDTEGNILQYTQINGPITSFIWGYDNEYPIVKGENITFLNLLLAHDNSSGLDYEDLIRSSSMTSDALISTYEYNPLVGVTKITDPSGQSVNYQYDNLRRLNSATDINSNLVQIYEYNYGSPINNGGLVVNSSLDIGVVTPGTSNTKYITIQNSGNYDITINDLSLTTYFSSVWDNNAFIIKAGEAFQLPITFNSPSTAVNQVNGTLTLHSLDNSSGDITVNLSAIGEYETRILTIPQSCYLITYSYQTISNVRINNDGNAPLTISSVTSDDPLIEPLNTNGLVIQPNSYVEFSVQLIGSLTSGNNWDGVATLTIYTDADQFSTGYIDIKTNCN